MKYSINDIKHAANGNWKHILSSIGIPTGCLKDQHQPCPMCGGKDRFRFDDKQGQGTYFCNQCGSGDGFGFVMAWQQCSFPDALRAVAGVLGMDTSQPSITPRPTPTPPAKEPETDQMPKLLRIWNATQPLANTPASDYLAARGLTPPMIGGASLRYHPNLAYWTLSTDEKPIKLGEFPAMVGAITDLQGDIQGLHITYLDPHQPRKLAIRHPETDEPLAAKKMQRRFSGSLKGCAVKLDGMSEQGRLMVAEGIETAFAARELFGLPVWACLSANNLAALVLPDGLTDLLIVADNDTPRPIGFQAAHDLATRALKAGVSVRIWQPETDGYDALDELNSRNYGQV